MGLIRPLSEEDVPQVADLHRRVMKTADRPSPELLAEYRAYLVDVLLNHPWRTEGIGPLVYEEVDGRITGFLAVMPRPLTTCGRNILAAVSSNFCVDPASRGLVGLKLMKTFLRGPQDLSLTDEANAASRTLWEGCGASASFIYSMHWTWPLRLGRCALLFLRGNPGLARLGTMLRPIVGIADALASRIGQNGAHQPHPPLIEEELDTEKFLDCLEQFSSLRVLRPRYDHRSFEWVLERIGRLRQYGELQKKLLTTATGEVAGWYLYCLKPSGISEVLQMEARRPYHRAVLQRLSDHAWRHDAIGLKGRINPQFIEALSDKHCLFYGTPRWMLIDSRDPDLVEAFQRGDTLISRLEGESCMHFR